ncbi:hypothetical protein [Dyadobacter luticola]|nr:hypothetical protein [Dyadobacter luticola]
MSGMVPLELFLSGEGVVRLITAYGNMFFLFVVLFLICIVIRLRHHN